MLRTSHDLRARLRAALPPAIRARDSVTVAAMRSALAALDNAEAVTAGSVEHRAGAVELAPKGPGATETARRTLADVEVLGVVRAEIDDRLTAAVDYEAAGHSDRAERLRAEAAVLESFVSSSGARTRA